MLTNNHCHFYCTRPCSRTCYLSAAVCSCSHGRMVCLPDHAALCQCKGDNAQKTVLIARSEDSLSTMLAALVDRSGAFDAWARDLHAILPFTRYGGPLLIRDGHWRLRVVVASGEPDPDYGARMALMLPSVDACGPAAVDCAAAVPQCRVVGKAVATPTMMHPSAAAAQLSTATSTAEVLRQLIDEFVGPKTSLDDLDTVLARAESQWHQDPLFTFAARYRATCSETMAFLAEVASCVPASDCPKREGGRRLGRVQMPVERLIDALRLAGTLIVRIAFSLMHRLFAQTHTCTYAFTRMVTCAHFTT